MQTTTPTPKVRTLITSTPDYELWTSAKLTWYHKLTVSLPDPTGYRPSHNYPQWFWKDGHPTFTPEPAPTSPLTPTETYEVKNRDGDTVELVKRYEYVVPSPVETAPQMETVTAVEVDTLPAPTPVYNPEPEPLQSYCMSAGNILDKVTGTKVSWETGEHGKHIRHGDMVLVGNPTTPLCGLVYAAHLRDLCKVWGRSQELTLIVKEEHLEIYPHTPDLMPNKVTLNWRAYDPKYEHEIVKLTHP